MGSVWVVPSILVMAFLSQTPERDQEMQSIAEAGQKFAYRYLHSTAKAMYARQAIIEYNKLFEVWWQWYVHVWLEDFYQLQLEDFYQLQPSTSDWSPLWLIICQGLFNPIRSLVGHREVCTRPSPVYVSQVCDIP